MGWLYPHSPSAGCEAATLPLRSLRMSSAPASNPSSRRTRGRVTILGCGRFQCKLETLLPPSRPFPSTRRTHLKPCARVQFKRSPDPQLRGAGPGRGRASPASDSGLLGPEVGGVGGIHQDCAGAAARRSVTERWELRLALARRHSAAGVCLSGPSSSAASHPSRSSTGAQRPGLPAGAGAQGGICARMNGRPGDARARG